MFGNVGEVAASLIVSLSAFGSANISIFFTSRCSLLHTMKGMGGGGVKTNFLYIRYGSKYRRKEKKSKLFKKDTFR